MFGSYSFSTYTKFFEKLTLLSPCYAHVRVRIKGLEMLDFRKISRTYLINDPLSYWTRLPCDI